MLFMTVVVLYLYLQERNRKNEETATVGTAVVTHSESESKQIERCRILNSDHLLQGIVHCLKKQLKSQALL